MSLCAILKPSKVGLTPQGLYYSERWSDRNRIGFRGAPALISEYGGEIGKPPALVSV